MGLYLLIKLGLECRAIGNIPIAKGRTQSGMFRQHKGRQGEKTLGLRDFIAPENYSEFSFGYYWN